MDLHGEWTTHVEVNAIPAELGECVAKLGKFVGIAGYDLRGGGDSDVGIGGTISEVFTSEFAMLEANEGGIVLVNTSDYFVVGTTIGGCGESLEWGEEEQGY